MDEKRRIAVRSIFLVLHETTITFKTKHLEKMKDMNDR
jgi:hypothetical protein